MTTHAGPTIALNQNHNPNLRHLMMNEGTTSPDIAKSNTFPNRNLALAYLQAFGAMNNPLMRSPTPTLTFRPAFLSRPGLEASPVSAVSKINQPQVLCENKAVSSATKAVQRMYSLLAGAVDPPRRKRQRQVYTQDEKEMVISADAHGRRNRLRVSRALGMPDGTSDMLLSRHRNKTEASMQASKKRRQINDVVVPETTQEDPEEPTKNSELASLQHLIDELLTEGANLNTSAAKGTLSKIKTLMADLKDKS